MRWRRTATIRGDAETLGGYREFEKRERRGSIPDFTHHEIEIR
jgi:hypothetical protein